MKILVNIITIAAVTLILFGGSAIESESILPVVMIAAGAAWLGLRIGITEYVSHH